MKIIVLLLVLMTSPVYALGSGSSPSWYLGAGVLSQNTGRLTKTADGSTSMFSSVFTQFSLIGRLPFLTTMGISPLISYTPLGHKSPEGGEKSTLLALGARLTNSSMNRISWAIGPGMLFYKVSGNGGTTDLNNGTGTTTFAIPSGSSTAALLFVDVGTSIIISSPLRLDLDALVTGAFSARRAFNLLATLNYGVW